MNVNMRVAFLTTEYPTEHLFAGGLASYVGRTAKALIQEGHDVEVFTLSHTQESIWDGRVLVHRVATSGSLSKRVSRARYIWRYQGYAQLLDAGWKLAMSLRKRHKELPFDIVQASNSRACGLVAAFMKIAPLITRLSTYEPLWREAYRKPLTSRQIQRERAEVLQMRWSRAVYAPSRLLADIVLRKEGLCVNVIEPPFQLEDALTERCASVEMVERDSYGLFFGTIGLLKGCARLVKVLPELLERNQCMRFVFLGRIFNTENGQRFDSHIREALCKYGNRVVVLAEQRLPHVLRIVANARFVVLPSKVDNFPNTCIEAMALERVVIGTHGASFDQLIEDGVNGFLVSQKNDEELSACIESLWNMRAEKRRRIGLLASNSIARLKPTDAISKLMLFYEEAISRR